MGAISWILFGLIAGAIAKAVHPGKDPGGWVVTVLVGIAGAIVGGFLGMILGWGDVTGFNLRSFILAVLGAVILLWVYRSATRGHRTVI